VEGDATVLIGAGEYHETVNITRSGPLTLLVCGVRAHVLQSIT